MVAYDICNPLEKNVTTVEVTVQRNNGAPKFPDGDKTVDIYENQQIGEQIIQVSAMDVLDGVSKE